MGDFQPVANVLSAPQIIVVRDGLPVKTLGELIAHAKANPGKLNYASSGNGSLQHVTGAMLEQQGGVKMVHVPYKGTGPALQDLLGGQVDLTFGTAPPFMPHIQSGKLRVLAVTGRGRLPSLPNVPTTAEAGYPKVDATSWFALFAPAATPPRWWTNWWPTCARWCRAPRSSRRRRSRAPRRITRGRSNWARA